MRSFDLGMKSFALGETAFPASGVDEFGEYHSPNVAFATNTSGQYTADIENFIQDEVLPLAQRRLIGFQLGDPLTLPKGRGITYTGTRFNRIPLPFAPLSEGVPPVGQNLTISQVTATAQQWGDLIKLTDVAELTIKHPVMNQANFVLGLQIAETLDRNTWNSLLAGTQINYVNARGSRAALQAGDVLDPHTINRTVAALQNIGAPMYDGQMETDTKLDANRDGAKMSGDKRATPHYCLIGNDFVLSDFAENNTVVLAWTYSDITKLYNYEFVAWPAHDLLEHAALLARRGGGQCRRGPRGRHLRCRKLFLPADRLGHAEPVREPGLSGDGGSDRHRGQRIGDDPDAEHPGLHLQRLCRDHQFAGQ